MSATPSAAPGRRLTRQREVVRSAVAEADAFRSAQQIHHQLHSRGETVGLATVYRDLQVLAESDEVDTMRNEDGEVLYRMCSPRHHHHLVCRSCGRVEEVRGPAVEAWATRAATEHGFREVAHTVELFGLCPTCQGEEARRTARSGKRGVDIAEEFRKPWTDETFRAADVVITMGCGDACPIFPGKRYEEWQLDDPAGQELETVRAIRDQVEERVRNLQSPLRARRSQPRKAA